MAYQGISTGTTPNDNTGDSLLAGAVKINSNFSEIYTALGDGTAINLGTKVVTTSGNQTVGGAKTFTNTVTTQQAFVGNGTIPIGGIIMWSGTIAAIPTGWALCDGTNGTPNLLDRFIVGAGSGYAVAATGGANSVTLTTTEMPSHNHPGSTAGSTTTLTGSFAAYGFQQGSGTGVFSSSATNNAEVGGNQSNKNFIQYNFNANHGHSVSVAAQGGNGAHENRPPYYALAFIMRTT